MVNPIIPASRVAERSLVFASWDFGRRVRKNFTGLWLKCSSSTPGFNRSSHCRDAVHLLCKDFFSVCRGACRVGTFLLLNIQCTNL